MALPARRRGGDVRSYADADFPTRVLERPEMHAAYVRDRSTRTRAFFRASGNRAPELFPGDAPVLLTIPYYVDDEMYWNRSGTIETYAYTQPVRVTLYRNGLPPVAVERPFQDLSNF